MRAGVARLPRLGEDVGTRGGGGRELLSGEALACQVIEPGLDPYESCPDTIHQGADSGNWSQGSNNSRDFL